MDVIMLNIYWHIGVIIVFYCIAKFFSFRALDAIEIGFLFSGTLLGLYLILFSLLNLPIQHIYLFSLPVYLLILTCIYCIILIERIRIEDICEKMLAFTVQSIVGLCIGIVISMVLPLTVWTKAFVMFGTFLLIVSPWLVMLIKQQTSNTIFSVSSIFPGVYYISQTPISYRNAPIWERLRTDDGYIDCNEIEHETMIELMRIEKTCKPGYYLIDTHENIMKIIKKNCKNKDDWKLIGIRSLPALLSERLYEQTTNLPKAACRIGADNCPHKTKLCVGYISKNFYGVCFKKNRNK